MVNFQIALKSKKKRLVVSHKRQYRPPPKDFFYLKEHPLGGSFRNFEQNLSMESFFIDPQSFFFLNKLINLKFQKIITF